MSASGLSDRARIVGIKVQPFPPLARCPEPAPIEGDADFWYVADKTRLFLACSRDEANDIATRLVHTSDGQVPIDRLPLYVLPFRVGNVWPAFPGQPVSKEDPAYQWHVEAQLEVRVPAGTFTDRFRILLYTNPDETIRWVCPSVGLVAEEYHHHGAIADYRAELALYRIGPPR